MENADPGEVTVVWDWILQNKTWLFSGGGITVLAIAWWVIKKIGSIGNLGATNLPANSPEFNSQTHSGAQRGQPPTARTLPDIKGVAYKAAFAGGIGKSCFIMSFRNDGWADATNVIAHIGYMGSSGQRLLVDYGCWVEHELVMNIGRGHTRNLIIVVTDDGKNFAVNDIGPATNYTQARMVEVGEITPGQWKLIVTLSADNFRKDYVFDLTVGKGASSVCTPEGTRRPAMSGRSA